MIRLLCKICIDDFRATVCKGGGCRGDVLQYETHRRETQKEGDTHLRRIAFDKHLRLILHREYRTVVVQNYFHLPIGSCEHRAADFEIFHLLP